MSPTRSMISPASAGRFACRALARVVARVIGRARGAESGQAAMLVLVALILVLTVIPTLTVTEVFGSLPVMTQADLRVSAAEAARSGLDLFVSAVEQDPELVVSGFPGASAVESQSACESGSGRGTRWQQVTTADYSTGRTSEEVLVAVDPPPGGATSGPVTVFAEGRAGSPGHWTCDEEKLATVIDGPVIDGPAPGTWKTYPAPSWAKDIYVSLAGAAGQGCENVPGNGSTVCSYSASHQLPTAGSGAGYVAELPLSSGAGGTIGIGVGAQPAPVVPNPGQPALDPGDPTSSSFASSFFGYGGPSGWSPSSASGLAAWLENDLHGADPTISFPGGGATMVYWCPPGPNGPLSDCTPQVPGAKPLAVAGGGGGSGSDGATFLTATIYLGGSGGSAGNLFGGLGQASGPWQSCAAASGCVAAGAAGTSGGGIPLIGPGGGSGGCGGGLTCAVSSTGLTSGSGLLANVLDGQPDPPSVGTCDINASLFGIDLLSASILYSGGGGGGGFVSGYQGSDGSQGLLNLFCDSISGSGGGGGGSSYLEPGASLMPSSLTTESSNGFAQLWFGGTAPGAPGPLTCGTLASAPAHQAEDAAVLIEGASGASNSNASGGAGAVLPSVVEVPAGDSLVASCSSAPGGSGGNAQSTPTPAGSGGAATVLCLVRGKPPSATCGSGDTPLAVAGGGGGAGDEGQSGGSLKACVVGCGAVHVGPIGTGFQAGSGGAAGVPLVPFGSAGSVAASAGSTGLIGTLDHGGFCLKLFSYSYCPSWNFGSSNPGSGGGAVGVAGGVPFQSGAAGSGGSACQVFEYSSSGAYGWIEGGAGGGGGGYLAGAGGSAGSTTCDSGGTGISCGIFGCYGVNYIYGWAIPGGGGGGGSTWDGGALGSSFGWSNPAPGPGSVPQGQTASSPGGGILLGTWPAESLTGPMVVASAPVGAASWAS